MSKNSYNEHYSKNNRKVLFILDMIILEICLQKFMVMKLMRLWKVKVGGLY